MVKVSRDEITPEHVYLNRRKFMVGIGSAASALALAACAAPGVQQAGAIQAAPPDPIDLPEALANAEPAASALTDELGDSLNEYDVIAGYNNYYEFSMDKEAVAKLSQDFATRPWEVKVGGLVENPTTYSIDDILTRFSQEERIYRLRCA